MISLMPLTRGVYPYDFFTHSKRFKKATTTTRGKDNDDDARVFYRVLPMLCRVKSYRVLLIWSRDDAFCFSLSFEAFVRKKQKFHHLGLQKQI
jgi:hypothetical protein